MTLPALQHERIITRAHDERLRIRDSYFHYHDAMLACNDATLRKFAITERHRERVAAFVWKLHACLIPNARPDGVSTTTTA